jgi:hypothetical protein
MSGLSGVSGVPQAAMLRSAGAQKSGALAAKAMLKDADGDHDGTAPGQVDAKDFGRGVKIDKQA